MALLRRGRMSVTDVCIAVGFTSLGSFSSTFTRLVGEPPSAYKARDHSRLAPVPPCMTRAWARPGWIAQPCMIGEAFPALPPRRVADMALSITHTPVYCTDLDEALAFYTQRLGFEVRDDVPMGPEMRWLTFTTPGDPHDLLLAAVDHHIPHADRLRCARLSPRATCRSSSRSTTWTRPSSRCAPPGTEILQEPVDQPYGVRDAAVRDPSGNHLRLSQQLAPQG